MPPAQAVAVATALAGALATLHEAGYLHGDVKPSNVGLTSNGSPKLLDFGLARAANDADSRGGTLRYLSPEVLSGRPAGEADDVWSLCVLLHEMVAGENPFAGGGIAEVTDRIRRQRLGQGARPAAGSGSPSAVIAFTASMLTAARSARPASAVEGSKRVKVDAHFGFQWWPDGVRHEPRERGEGRRDKAPERFSRLGFATRTTHQDGRDTEQASDHHGNVPAQLDRARLRVSLQPLGVPIALRSRRPAATITALRRARKRHRVRRVLYVLAQRVAGLLRRSLRQRYE